jgi:hypothetical protein
MKGINGGLILGMYTYAGFGHMYRGLFGGGEPAWARGQGQGHFLEALQRCLLECCIYYLRPISSIETF